MLAYVRETFAVAVSRPQYPDRDARYRGSGRTIDLGTRWSLWSRFPRQGHRQYESAVSPGSSASASNRLFIGYPAPNGNFDDLAIGRRGGGRGGAWRPASRFLVNGPGSQGDLFGRAPQGRPDRDAHGRGGPS